MSSVSICNMAKRKLCRLKVTRYGRRRLSWPPDKLDADSNYVCVVVARSESRRLGNAISKLIPRGAERPLET